MTAPAASGAKAKSSCPGGPGRFPYPVVVKGAPQLSGYRVGNFMAMAYGDGLWRRIPVQVDEVNTRGDYVLEQGLPFTKDTDDGWFDRNDELVLWGGDLGHDFEPGTLPSKEMAGALGEWRIRFCRKGGEGVGTVLLLALKDAPAPLEAVDHVRFDPKKDEIETSLYRYVFDRDHPALLGGVALKKGADFVPVIASSNFLMPLSMPWYLPDLWFRRDDFQSSIESWRQGALRTLVAVGVKYESFLSLFRLHLFSELVFYRNRFEIPSVVEFTFDPSGVLDRGSGIAYALSFPNDMAWEIESNLTPLPGMGEEEERTMASDFEVFQARGHAAQGAFQVQVRVDPDARRLVPPPRLIKGSDFRDAGKIARWPWLRETHGDLGIFLDFSGVRKGVYDFGLDLLLSPKANETFTDYGSLESEWRSLSP